MQNTSFTSVGSITNATTASSTLEKLEVWTKKHSLALVMSAAAVCWAYPAIGLTVRATNLGRVPLTGWSYDLLTLALSFIMLSASIQCRPRDFADVAASATKVPFAGSVYLAGPMIGLVLGTIALGTLHDDVALPLALGLVLLGLMPIAMTSAAWVRLNAGNVPLLLGAIVITNVIAVPVVPVLLRWIAAAGHATVGAPMRVGPVVQQLTLAILLPVALGMTLRAKAPRLLDRVKPLLSLLSTTGLLLSLGSTVSASRPHVLGNVSSTISAVVFTLLFNVALYAAGVKLVRLAKLPRTDAVTVLFASGMRNMGAAMVVAAIAFPEAPLVAIPAAIFSVSQQLMSGLMTSLLGAHPELVDVATVVTAAPLGGSMRPTMSRYPSTMPPPNA